MSRQTPEGGRGPYLEDAAQTGCHTGWGSRSVQNGIPESDTEGDMHTAPHIGVPKLQHLCLHTCTQTAYIEIPFCLTNGSA